MAIHDLISFSPTPLIASEQIEVALIFLTLATTLPFVLAFHLRYLAYLSLGPGGTPASFLGFLKIQALGLFAVKDPFNVDPTLHTSKSSTGFLTGFPKRAGSPPEVRGVAPQRQITQKAGEKLFKRLAAHIESMALASDTIIFGTSCFERHGIGLFSTTPAYPTKHRCKSEICHLHGIDGSMHMLLHPVDAQAVFDAGWGQKHPLARGGFFERFVPVGFVMVYAPRDEMDVETVMRIVRAAAWFVGGECSATEAQE
jgi:hypothetical protein